MATSRDAALTTSSSAERLLPETTSPAKPAEPASMKIPDDTDSLGGTTLASQVDASEVSLPLSSATLGPDPSRASTNASATSRSTTATAATAATATSTSPLRRLLHLHPRKLSEPSKPSETSKPPKSSKPYKEPPDYMFSKRHNGRHPGPMLPKSPSWRDVAKNNEFGMERRAMFGEEDWPRQSS